jgi:chromosome segregation ATPase
MSNAHITVTPEEFKEVKKRIEKLETIPEVSNIEKIKSDVHEVDKEQVSISGQINALRTEMRVENKSLRTEMNERFNTTNEKINSVRTELRITPGLILTGIVAIIIKLSI